MTSNIRGKFRAVESGSEGLPLPSVTVGDPLTLTIFGASGDLTARKLMPGLFAMQAQGLLAKKVAIVGFARRDYTDEVFRDLMKDAIRKHSRVPVEEEVLNTFIQCVCYHRGDLTDESSYAALKQRFEDTATFPENRLHYLAIRPKFFEPVVAALKENGLVTSPMDPAWTRVVVEKPFGHDLKSAVELNRSILAYLDESQIYRIDHYLGKETVQNILSFRFSNAVFEPLFNNRYVEHVQITAGETVGMESGRGAYYDASGALRDMVQNHLMQLLCLVAMEPPSTLQSRAVHNQKSNVLQSIQPLTANQVASSVVRAQYVAGEIDGAAVPGYSDEDRIAPDSRTETFVALRLNVNSWRWAGVPFCLRTGKRLRKRATEIVVRFKSAPLQWFNTVECEGDVCDLTRAEPNELVFRIQPDEGISLHFSAKRPQMQLVVEGVDMDFSYAETWEKSLPEAYERLLLDVMRGDSTLFTRSDEVEAAWGIVDPILQAWSEKPEPPLYTYTAGSWGPREAGILLNDTVGTWRAP